MTKLAKGQRNVLLFIVKYKNINGTLPLMNEIRRHFKWRSPSYPKKVIEALIHAGYLEKTNSNSKYKLSSQYQLSLFTKNER